jgi:hypothetical protein
MFTVHRCSACKSVWDRSECPADPDGVFGPERACPRCGGLVRSALTGQGWFVTLLAAAALAVAIAAVGWPG